MSKNIFKIPVNFEVKNLSDGEQSITIEGFANTTTVDRVGDIILEEAWTKGGLTNYLKNPIILAYHNQERPIGKMIEHGVSSEGLRITAEILSSAGEIFSLIKEGVLKTFSIGFRTREADYDVETDIFVIKDLELLEVSVVSIPANADSTFSVRKSFETDEEYASFKSEFKKGATTVNTEEVSKDNSDNIEETIMPDKLKAEMEAQIRADIEKERKEELARKEAITKEVSSQLEVTKTATVQVMGERVEALKEELETRLADEQKGMSEALAGVESQIKEYAEKLTALNNNKMEFLDKSNRHDVFTDRQKDDAVLISKMAKVPVEETKYFNDLVTKSEIAHQSGMTASWETGFSTRLWDNIREKLIVEPLFIDFPMTNVVVNLPLNPEAGYGTWVTTAQLGTAASSGTGKTHGIQDTNITAHKLATKEFLSYEEENDSMIAMVPLIREASVRRMAKSSDKALLIGNTGTSAGTNEGLYPFDGLAQIGINAGRTKVIAGTLAAPTAVTVANMQALRRQLGVFGHNPSDVIYIVNHDVYFDLLEDPDFRTMDLVGDKATILTGQVGRIAGSPVVVSGEFPAAAASNAAAVCVNMSNYLKGSYLGLTVERERSVENQTNLLVVTRRFGTVELFSSNATVSTLINPAV